MNGTLVVIVTAAGHVAATEADFEQGAAAGYTVAEMQERRATQAAWSRVMMEFCHPDIGRAVHGLTLNSVAAALRASGWKVYVTPISTGEPTDGEA